jgi:RNA polymerase sigma-70 factor, ECF subfamily
MAQTAGATAERRFERLHEEHFEAVRRYAWRRDPASADDIAAETFVVAWRRLDEVPHDALPWLIGVARNVRLNLLRSQRRQANVVHALRSTTPTTSAGGEDVHSHALPEAIADALAALSPLDREVLLLHVWEELERGEIATALGCSKANVSVRFHRAKRRFEHALRGAEHNDSGRLGVTASEGANHGC